VGRRGTDGGQMQEQLAMARVCSLWSAKLSATTGVLNTNILRAFFLCICVCVCVCVRACVYVCVSVCVRVHVRGNQVSHYC
jgi:hypothetical protein